MKIRKRKLIETEEGKAVLSVNTCYCSNQNYKLLQNFSYLTHSDTFGEIFQRKSYNNGEKWTEPELIFKPYKTKEGVLRIGESCLFFDTEKESILRFFNLSIYPDDTFSGSSLKLTRIFYQISFDQGESFSQPIQLVQKGYQENHPARGVIYRKNSIVISFCFPTKVNNKILLPCQKIPINSDFNHPFSIKWQAGCFIGKWKNKRIEWELSETVKIPPEISSRGLCEPTIAELEDGTLLMVMRGSNAGMEDKPGYKWMSISKDGGYTWSKPFPFTYSNGENFFSPATGSVLIRSIKNGNLYWIGNITPENPNGNRPRYPLVIGIVDEKKMGIVKKSIRVIENKRKEDSVNVQFSNFRVYQDRKTKEIVLIMARIEEKAPGDLTSPAYEYRVQL